MTEDEANLTKCCGPEGCGGNSAGGSERYCVARMCMAWRFKTFDAVSHPREQHVGFSDQPRTVTITTKEGYCGLAGKP